MNVNRPDFSSVVDTAHAQLVVLPEYDSFPIDERLTAFFFILLDALEDNEIEAETLSTEFDMRASIWWSPFHTKIRSVLPELLSSPDMPGVNLLVAGTSGYRFLIAELLVQLLSTSLADDSEDKQRSAALADKVFAFAASILTSPVIGNATDVFRYAVEAGYIAVERIPFVSSWLNSNEEPS